MEIYFAGSIRAGRQDADRYAEIVKMLQRWGTVLTEHVGDVALDPIGERHLSEAEIYRRDIVWLNEADVVVAEVTVPSLGVGYEIAVAERAGKPVLCLYRPQPDKKLSAMLTGSPHLIVKEYQAMAEAEEIVKEFLGVRA